MPTRDRWLTVLALLVGLSAGWLGHQALNNQANIPTANGDEMYEDFRAMWWSISEGFCPEGFRVVGRLDSPVDSHSVVVPPEWYAPSPEASALVYEQDYWRTTQRNLGWVNDTEGYAMIVHMVFTDKDWGRGPLAFPTANALADIDSFRADWHFVGTRDNVVFFFQMVPLDPSLSTQYPRDWIERCFDFVGEFRQYLDGEL